MAQRGIRSPLAYGHRDGPGGEAKGGRGVEGAGIVSRLRIILEMIKFEHTVFALPFALVSALFAAGGLPAWRTLGWIMVAMVGARSSAMAFNRLVDCAHDARNPRTAARALPTGLLKPAQVWLFVAISTLVFVVAAAE